MLTKNMSFNVVLTSKLSSHFPEMSMPKYVPLACKLIGAQLSDDSLKYTLKILFNYVQYFANSYSYSYFMLC